MFSWNCNKLFSSNLVQFGTLNVGTCIFKKNSTNEKLKIVNHVMHERPDSVLKFSFKKNWNLNLKCKSFPPAGNNREIVLRNYIERKARIALEINTIVYFYVTFDDGHLNRQSAPLNLIWAV